MSRRRQSFEPWPGGRDSIWFTIGALALAAYVLSPAGKAAREERARKATQGEKAAAVIHPVGKAVLGYFGADNETSEHWGHETTVATIDKPAGAGDAAGREAGRVAKILRGLA